METFKKHYLVTGSAGFIGFHTAKQLLEQGVQVIGVDNFNDYYDNQLKEDRNQLLQQFDSYTLYRGNIADLGFVKRVFSENPKIDAVCHLAAQAGVRYSIENPYVYIDSNIVGFTNLINEAKNASIKSFVFASSSSVYGNQDTMPFSEDMITDQPISLYAATKKANELIAYTYHHLYGMRCTGLRFFTVYGPWGRPDMAMVSFAQSIIKGNPIQVFNNGNMERDFTYIDDIVEGIIKSLERNYPFEILNLGNNDPFRLSVMVELLESALGKKAIKEFLPIQPGDVVRTYADIRRAQEKLDWKPVVTFEDGVQRFASWFKEYYKIS